jgi:hypothetical protein
VAWTGGSRENSLFQAAQMLSAAQWGKTVENSLMFGGLITFGNFWA